MMASDIKFKNLSKMVDGRFRFLKGMPRISNLLNLNIDDAMDAILQDEEGEL